MHDQGATAFASHKPRRQRPTSWLMLNQCTINCLSFKFVVFLKNKQQQFPVGELSGLSSWPSGLTSNATRSVPLHSKPVDVFSSREGIHCNKLFAENEDQSSGSCNVATQ